jgi:hypothetical protein
VANPGSPGTRVEASEAQPVDRACASYLQAVVIAGSSGAPREGILAGSFTPRELSPKCLVGSTR